MVLGHQATRVRCVVGVEPRAVQGVALFARQQVAHHLHRRTVRCRGRCVCSELFVAARFHEVPVVRVEILQLVVNLRTVQVFVQNEIDVAYTGTALVVVLDQIVFILGSL